MSTSEDEVDTNAAPQGALAALQSPDLKTQARAFADNYFKQQLSGENTRGEAAIFQQEDQNAEQVRQALRQAREKLAAQRLDPSVLGLRFAQAMMAPSRYGIPDQWSKAAGAVADWRQQNQQFQQQQGAQDLSLQEQLANVDQQSLKSRLALEELKQRTGAQTADTALKILAKPGPQGAESPVGKMVTDRLGSNALQTPEGQELFDRLSAQKDTTDRPHYTLVEHDVKLSDGTPGKQTFLFDSTSGKATPYNDPVPSVKGAGLDARSGVMFQRVLSSANEAASAIKNITELPVGASSGWFGVGESPGHSLLSSAKGVLTNKLAPQSVQDYLSVMPGLNRNLATIETAGLAPQGSLTGSFDALQLRDGDTGYTTLHKLAEYRQVLEKGIETNLSNPRIPEEQKEAVRQIINTTRDAIPFTHHDVTMLERTHQTHPDMTMQDYLKSQGLGSTSGNHPLTNAKGWALHKDAQGNMAYMSPDGKQWEEVK